VPLRSSKPFLEQRLASSVAETALVSCSSKVSVCIASYNSGHYIDLQLRSILPQLGADDEVVVVDDNSSDDTSDRIRALADPRIRLVLHTQNAGVVRSFEHALCSATGDLLFLCDHDDLWAPEKVQRFREAFHRGSHIQLVMSAVSLIDTDGASFRDKRWDRDGQFRRGFLRNILKNGYQGSAMAIRSSLRDAVLPFPRNRSYLHDAWIGTMNDRMGGGMVFLPEPLLLYRRHQTNVSQKLGLPKRALSRIQLLLDHFLHLLRTRARLQKNAGTPTCPGGEG
jgi:glycosyltransferase involved in cell wall biosynthesis